MIALQKINDFQWSAAEMAEITRKKLPTYTNFKMGFAQRMAKDNKTQNVKPPKK